MLFTTLPMGSSAKWLEVSVSHPQPVWLEREHAEMDTVDFPSEVWGVMAGWETDTFELNREDYPMSKARGLRFSSALVNLKEQSC